MSDGQSTATINYEDRSEAIRYRGEGRELVAECTHGHGTRLYADSVKQWSQPPAELTDAERLLVLSELPGVDVPAGISSSLSPATPSRNYFGGG